MLFFVLGRSISTRRGHSFSCLILFMKVMDDEINIERKSRIAKSNISFNLKLTLWESSKNWEVMVACDETRCLAPYFLAGNLLLYGLSLSVKVFSLFFFQTLRAQTVAVPQDTIFYEKIVVVPKKEEKSSRFYFLWKRHPLYVTFLLMLTNLITCSAFKCLLKTSLPSSCVWSAWRRQSICIHLLNFARYECVSGTILFQQHWYSSLMITIHSVRQRK